MDRTEPLGLFVVFEGIDGSGKTTLCDRVTRTLRKRGLVATQVREKGRYASAVTQSIRELGRDQQNLAMTASTELLLVLAREVQLFEEATRPALRRSDVVLADRFIYTAEVLARHGRGLPESRVRGVIQAVSGGLQPDLVVLVDVDPQLARARRKVSKLLADGARPSSRKGLAGAGLQHRLRAGYRELAARDPARWVVVDNSDTSLELIEAAIVDGLLAVRSRGLQHGHDLLEDRLGRLAQGSGPTWTASTLAQGQQRLLDWVDRRAHAEPDLAAYFLAGLRGPGVDERRLALAERSPVVIAHGLRGLGDEVSWRLRRALAEVAPAAVATSLLDLPAGPGDVEAIELRRALLPRAPHAVAASLLHCDSPKAWALRDVLQQTAPLAVMASLAELPSLRAWGWREGFLAARGGEAALADQEVADAVCRSVTGLDDARAWTLREACRPTTPVAAIASLTGVHSQAAHDWRARYLESAPRPVLRSLLGVDDAVAFTLRERSADTCKESIGSLARLAGPRAWLLRQRCRDLWPSTVGASLGPALAQTAPGTELLSYLLEHHGGIGMWRAAASVAAAAAPT